VLRRDAHPGVAPAAIFRRRTLADREDLLGRILLAPALIYVILLVAAPLALAILLSFSASFAGSLEFHWTGLRNFATIIQDPQFRPVARYEGCYCNVVGLPLSTTVELLRRAGLDITVSADSLLPQCGSCPLRPLV